MTEKDRRDLKFSFPYDWSNPKISDEALIFNVLKRGIFEDVCAACVFFGIERVEEVWKGMDPELIRDKSLARMLNNIKEAAVDEA